VVPVLVLYIVDDDVKLFFTERDNTILALPLRWAWERQRMIGKMGGIALYLSDKF
jgi:hypothetical protein